MFPDAFTPINLAKGGFHGIEKLHQALDMVHNRRYAHVDMKQLQT